MARTNSTNHLAPDIHDEGLIKRYGLSIAITVLTVVLLLFLAWATDWALNYAFSSNGRGSEIQGTQNGPTN